MVKYFTWHDGSIMEINDYSSPADTSPPPEHVTQGRTSTQSTSRLSTGPKSPARPRGSKRSHSRVSSPLFFTTNSDDNSLPSPATMPPLVESSAEHVVGKPSHPQKSADEQQGPSKRWMLYNEYGELVDVEKELQPVDSSNITVLQALRLIRKTCHHEFKKRMRAITTPVLSTRASSTIEEDLRHNPLMQSPNRFTTWQLTPLISPWPKTPTSTQYNIPVYSGPPRVLEIGCDDGYWCTFAKKNRPEWIVEGVDDVDRWSVRSGDRKVKDFMEPVKKSPENDYFGNVHLSQSYPEFTVRNLNHLISHPNPIPQNLYGMIRGRHIFDRIESYKTFLEDVRSILQPDGVVEFLEIDPRPRVYFVGRRRSDAAEHRSKPENDWTDNIADRFKDPSDAELATSMPALMKRVEVRLSAILRPKDGVPAAKLKSWLQGAGFWDAKQMIIRLPIGGHSQAGKLMLQILEWQGSLEDSIPVLKSSLPEVDYDELNYANLYVNFHIITARKPSSPRAGDLLKDGTRLEMSPQREFAMKRLNDATSNQWQRFNLDENLTGLLESLISLDTGVDLATLGPPEGAERKHRKSVSEGFP